LRSTEGADLAAAPYFSPRALDPCVAIVGRARSSYGHHALVLLRLQGVVEAAADEALDREQGVGGVGDRLALGRGAAQDLAVVGISHDGRRGARAFRVLDDLGLAAFHDGDAAVGGAEVDADDLAHDFSFISSLRAGTPANFLSPALAGDGIP
jgi:hypothetical protein